MYTAEDINDGIKDRSERNYRIENIILSRDGAPDGTGCERERETSHNVTNNNDDVVRSQNDKFLFPTDCISLCAKVEEVEDNFIFPE